MNWHFFKTGIGAAPLAEKVKSGLAAAMGIFILALSMQILSGRHVPVMLLASMGASAALLYAVPHSPMAQPWSLMGGNLVSALMGWLTIHLIPDPTLAAAVAVGAAVFAMYVLNCLHPPGAATALVCVLNATAFQAAGGAWLAWIVVGNAGMLLFSAWVVNRFIPGRHYPAQPVAPAPKPPIHPTLEASDIEWALSKMDSSIDVSEKDLLEIYMNAQQHAAQRPTK
jgi:CBS-domain-containing membrane protein